MRKTSLIIVFLFVVVSLACQPQGGPEKPATQGTKAAAIDLGAEEQAVSELLDDYMNAVELEDMDYYSAVVDHGHDNVFIGSGAADYVVGWEALQKLMQAQNDALSDITIVQTDLKIHILPDAQTAWATCLWDFSATAGEKRIELPLRCTWAIAKLNGEWKIIHFHKSIGTQ